MRLSLYNKLSKFVLFQIMFVIFLFGSAHQAKASIWGESLYASINMKQFLEEVSTQIHGAITGAFKQAVGQIMNTQISTMVGMGSNGPMFIANWQTFLVSDPRNKTNAYMNDFFSTTTRGRNSLSNYRQAPSSFISGSGSSCESGGYTGTLIEGGCVINSGDASTKIGFLDTNKRSWLAGEGIIPTAQAAVTGDGGVGKQTSAFLGDENYYKYQTDTAKQAINPSTPDVDLMNYVSGPSEIFNGGNWRGFNSFFSNPANNPFGYSMMAKEAYQGKLAMEMENARTQAVAYQGFKASVGADGVTVKTPGITIGQIVDKVQGFSMDSISSAQDWGQLISSGITSAATMAINTAVQTGLNSATGALSEATSGMINLDASSLASTDWNGSGAGSASEFDTGMNNFNADATNGINGGNDTWGGMNFAGAGYQDGGSLSSGQDSYSQFGNVSFESPSNTSVYENTPSFIPDIDFPVSASDVQSSGSFWAPK